MRHRAVSALFRAANHGRDTRGTHGQDGHATKLHLSPAPSTPTQLTSRGLRDLNCVWCPRILSPDFILELRAFRPQGTVLRLVTKAEHRHRRGLRPVISWASRCSGAIFSRDCGPSMRRGVSGRMRLLQFLHRASSLQAAHSDAACAGKSTAQHTDSLSGRRARPVKLPFPLLWRKAARPFPKGRTPSIRRHSSQEAVGHHRTTTSPNSSRAVRSECPDCRLGSDRAFPREPRSPRRGDIHCRPGIPPVLPWRA